MICSILVLNIQKSFKLETVVRNFFIICYAIPYKIPYLWFYVNRVRITNKEYALVEKKKKNGFVICLTVDNNKDTNIFKHNF